MYIRYTQSALALIVALMMSYTATAQSPTSGFAVVQPATPPFVEVADTNSAEAKLPPDMQKAVDAYLKERDARKRVDDEEKQKELMAKALASGTKFPLQSYWDNGLWFETPNKEWRFHLGGRFQFEPIWWAQPQSLKGPAPGNGGLPASAAGAGVGTLDDGIFFRRVRFRTDGVVYEKFEYQMEVNFEQLNFITYDHLWFGVKDVPLLGTVRIGQHKVPQGLEMIGSDYHLSLLERSSLADSHWTLFAPGIFVMNNYMDQRMVVQSMIHRVQPTQFYTSDFGGGDYATTSRVTGLP
jgi:phosphate-selective porin OprO and OprP